MEQILQMILLFVCFSVGCSFFVCLHNPLLYEKDFGQKEHEKACLSSSIKLTHEEKFEVHWMAGCVNWNKY